MSNNDEFSTPPAGGGGLRLADLLGETLAVEVLEALPAVPTSFGDAPALRVNAVVTSGDEFPDALIFGRGMYARLRQTVGKKVLLTVAQGEAKKGQSPPWIPQTPTDADQKRAIAAWEKSSFASTNGSKAKAEQDLPDF